MTFTSQWHHTASAISRAHARRDVSREQLDFVFAKIIDTNPDIKKTTQFIKRISIDRPSIGQE